MKTIRFAFQKTIPVLCGYIFLGIAFGILLQQAGFNFIWAFFISLFVYAGSMQFVLVTFLSSGISLVSVALTTLSVNCRHIFYGISFIEKFKEMGKVRPYMIYALTDETYSLLCSTNLEDKEEENKVYFYMTILDHSYWIIGSVLGALVGEIIPFDSTGIDFAMTALFVVICVEQWLGAKSHVPAMIGAGCGILCLIFLGSSRFLLPALVLTVLCLLGWKKKLNGTEDQVL